MQIKKMSDSNSKKLKSFSLFYSRWTAKAMIFCISKPIEQNHKDLLLIPCNLSIYPKEMGRAWLKLCQQKIFLKIYLLTQDLRNV